MNTKTFAQQSRTLLMEGVANKLLYWGFNKDGTTTEEPNPVAGGYTFRGKVFDDETVPDLWKSLQQAIKSKGIDVIKEEAAYTWFNRMMALQIMAKNDYQDDQLAYVPGMANTPQILQKARQGQYAFLTVKEQERLKRIITDFSKEQEAFALLLVGYCHSNKMLNNVFGRLDDYTELLLPDNMLKDSGFLHLLNTTDAITDEQYKEVELIGWLYQFYISERKDEVFASFKKKKKAEAKDIPAATQIFTPNWIVKYMVQNTVGKIWLDKNPNSKIKPSMKYLVENESDSTSEPIISEVSQLTLIDPAAGSGHILVEGFDLLYQMYMEEYYTPEEAVESIFKNNLFGLDIDDRAAQLATFAILLKAAKQYRDVFVKGWLPNVFSFPENKIDDYFIKDAVNVSELKNSYLGYEIAEAVIAKETLDFADDDTGEVVSIKKEANLIKKGSVLSEKEIEILIKNKISQVEIYPYRNIKDFLETDDSEIILEIAKGLSELRKGKNLGSTLKVNLLEKSRTQLTKQYSAWAGLNKKGTLDIHQIAIWKDLQRFFDVLLILSNKYTSVVANPPYMGQVNMNGELKDYVNANYPETKSDLMTIFMEVIPNMTLDKSRFALINLPSWLFLSSSETLRKSYILNYQFDSLLHMGRGIFGIDFGSVAFSMRKEQKEIAVGSYFRLHERNFQHILFQDIEKLFLYSNGNINYKYDFNLYRDEEGITEIPEKGTINGQRIFYPNIRQDIFGEIPGSPIAYWVSKNLINVFSCDSLNSVSPPRQGIATSDNDRFLKLWHEVSLNKIGFGVSKTEIEKSDFKWYPYNKGGEFRKWYGNNYYILNWEHDGSEIKSFENSVIRNEDFQLEPGITWSLTSSGGFGARIKESGFFFDVNGMSVFPQKSYRSYLIGFLNSVLCNELLKIINPTIAYQVGDIAKLPIKKPSELNKNIVEKLSDENIDYSKNHWDSHETSWDFEKTLLLNKSQSLKSSYHKWQQDVTKVFFHLHANEEELNRIFIDIYGLKDELNPKVALKDITILQDELKKNDLEALEDKFRTFGSDAIELPIKRGEVISQFISYAIGLFMGRYRLDKPGLNIAHPNPSKEELASYTYNHGEVIIDQDAILPIMGKNCNFNDDVLKQFSQLLDTIWGHEQRTENINFIQECLDKELEKFLVNDFWKYHCGMYKKTPIYWLFSSKKGAFQVLVYMHRMNEFTVEKIRANYLLEHLKYIKSEIAQKEANASSLSTAEAKQLDKLRSDLSECEQYDMALKNVADQQIKFDLDDGVAKNYELFETVVAKIK
jgi:type II restriction/modification system DNA methylase subunit YeeA